VIGRALVTAGEDSVSQYNRARLSSLEQDHGFDVVTAQNHTTTAPLAPGKQFQFEFTRRGAMELVHAMAMPDGATLPFDTLMMDYPRPHAMTPRQLSELKDALAAFVKNVLPVLIECGVVSTGSSIICDSAAAETARDVLEEFDEHNIRTEDYPLWWRAAAVSAPPAFVCFTLADRQRARATATRIPMEERFTEVQLKELAAYHMSRLRRQEEAIRSAIAELGIGALVLDTYSKPEEAVWGLTASVAMSEALYQLGIGGLGIYAKRQMSPQRKQGARTLRELGVFAGWHVSYDQFQQISERAAFNTAVKITNDYVVIGNPAAFGAIINAPTGVTIANGADATANATFTHTQAWRPRTSQDEHAGAEAETESAARRPPHVADDWVPYKFGAVSCRLWKRNVFVTLKSDATVGAGEEFLVQYGSSFFRRTMRCCENCYRRNKDRFVQCTTCESSYAHAECLPASARNFVCGHCTLVRKFDEANVLQSSCSPVVAGSNRRDHSPPDGDSSRRGGAARQPRASAASAAAAVPSSAAVTLSSAAAPQSSRTKARYAAFSCAHSNFATVFVSHYSCRSTADRQPRRTHVAGAAAAACAELSTRNSD
jgi:hypothetical protein